MPFWPLGLPRWPDPVVALGMRARHATYLVVWRRGPLDGAGLGEDTGVIVLPVPHLAEAAPRADVLYPGHAGTSTDWIAADRTLAVTLPSTPSACLIRLADDGPGR